MRCLHDPEFLVNYPIFFPSSWPSWALLFHNPVRLVAKKHDVLFSFFPFLFHPRYFFPLSRVASGHDLPLLLPPRFNPLRLLSFFFLLYIEMGAFPGSRPFLSFSFDSGSRKKVEVNPLSFPPPHPRNSSSLQFLLFSGNVPLRPRILICARFFDLLADFPRPSSALVDDIVVSVPFSLVILQR